MLAQSQCRSDSQSESESEYQAQVQSPLVQISGDPFWMIIKHLDVVDILNLWKVSSLVRSRVRQLFEHGSSLYLCVPLNTDIGLTLPGLKMLLSLPRRLTCFGLSTNFLLWCNELEFIVALNDVITRNSRRLRSILLDACEGADDLNEGYQLSLFFTMAQKCALLEECRIPVVYGTPLGTEFAMSTLSLVKRCPLLANLVMLINNDKSDVDNVFTEDSAVTILSHGN